MVYHELRGRYEPKGFDLYYYEDRSSEADFLVCKGRHVESIVQVAYDISSKKVRQRELRGAQNAATATRCDALTIVTYNDREDASTPNGLPVEIIPAHEWFCKDNLSN
jgi:predicted AAA+ superfamily ATPase